MNEFETLLSRYEALLLKCERMEKTAFQAQEMAKEIAAKSSPINPELALENHKAICMLSMKLGNPCVEAWDDTGIAGGLVRYVLDRLKRAEDGLEDIRG